MRVMRDVRRIRNAGGMERHELPGRHRPPIGLAALVAGAVTVAILGSGVMGTTSPGAADFVTQNVIGLVGAVLLALGIVGVRSTLVLFAGGRLLRWGLVLLWIGLGALAAGHAVAIGTAGASGMQNDLAGAVAFAGIPLTIGAHLIYPGTSLVGLALLRGRRAPRALGVLLVASLPVVLVGVPAGLALGMGALGEIVAWIATEGQIGVAWVAFGAFAALRGRMRPEQARVAAG